MKSKTKKKKASATRVATAFSHPGKFDILDSVVSEGSEEEATICAGNEDREVEVEADEVEDEQKVVKLMPRWDSEFWKVYGNKLRVNGTVEGVCDLLVHPKKTSLI